MEAVYQVKAEENSQRLDQFLKERSGLSRSDVQKWIRAGKAVKLPDGAMVRANYHVKEGDEISFSWEEKKELKVVPENIPLQILYEDDSMIVINKARGMIIHPGAGHTDGTLANALLYHCGPSLLKVGDPLRPGIVHRLDKDTSGVMVAAKTPAAYEFLKEEIGTHRATRKYFALVHGQLEGEFGTINLPLGRDLKDRKKWAVTAQGGREAITHYHVLAFYPHYSWVECRLETGRTHQIRVHMAHIGHPVVNDPLYGWKKDHFPIEGQVLHSHSLDIQHPVTKEWMHFEAPIGDDIKKCLFVAERDK
jgi:23S rRNA pseudouridine1911/1915/1917 synthase